MMRLLRVALVASLVALPGLAWAESASHGADTHQGAGDESGHDGHGELSFSGLFENTEFLGTLVNFTVLILLLAWVIRTKGNPALADRRKQVQEELAEAQRLRVEAEKRHGETALRLEKLDQEMVQIRAEMIKAGEKERDQIVAQAEEKAARMRRDTSFLIEQQIKQLREDLTKEAAGAAVLAAQQILQEATSETDQDRLAQAYLDRLDEVLEERQS